jgi:molecular chaperone GrpE
MRIPITIHHREVPWGQDNGYSLSGRPPGSEESGYRTGRSCRDEPDASADNPRLTAGDSKTAGQNGDGSHFPDGRADLVKAQRTAQTGAAGRDESNEDWKDRYIRLRADFENYRRHAEAQREELAAIGKEKVLEDVFPLVEHMERAMKAAKEVGDQTGILEGIEMVYQELLRVLEKNGVQRIDTVGKPFDPKIHEAVSVAPHPDYPEDTVVEEVKAGFVKDGKLLRPASVVVAQIDP